MSAFEYTLHGVKPGELNSIFVSKSNTEKSQLMLGNNKVINKKKKVVVVTRTEEVSSCSECFNCQQSMDGPFCIFLERKLGDYMGMVYPEGRNGIHPQCPFLNE